MVKAEVIASSLLLMMDVEGGGFVGGWVVNCMKHARDQQSQVKQMLITNATFTLVNHHIIGFHHGGVTTIGMHVCAHAVFMRLACAPR